MNAESRDAPSPHPTATTSQSYSFDLVTEPWIPVVPLDGSALLVEVGLRDAVLRAHEWREIADPSPLVTYALHRLLLAIVHRTVGPSGTPGPVSVGAWGELWQRGHFPAEPLAEYLARGQAEGWFNLFDPTRPFYQSTQAPIEKGGPAQKLAFELATDDLHFDHRKDPEEHPLSAAEAARALVAHQAFSLGGITNGGSAAGGLITKAILPLVRGKSLFETLCLNLVIYNPKDGDPFPFDPALDKPAWELPAPDFNERRLPFGYLDVLTWQSRAIRLEPAHDEKGRLVVPRAVIFPGARLPDSDSLYGLDPAVWFREVPGKAGEEAALRVVGLREERALWRDSDVLLMHAQGETGRGGRPKLFAVLQRYLRAQYLDRSRTLPLDLFGMVSDQKKVNLWRHERLPMPAVYLDDPDLVYTLSAMLRKAEDVSGLFRSAPIPAPWNPDKKTSSPARLLAEYLLTEGERSPDPADVTKLVQDLALEQRYWGQLAPHFHHLITTLPTDEAAAEEQWLRAIERVARNVFENAWLSMDRSARTTQAFARAGNIFYSALNANVGSAGSPSAATA